MGKSINFHIEQLRLWRNGNWVKYESKSPKVLLRIQHDQLIITTENKVLESLSTNGKLKGILKSDVLILIISVNGQEVRKIKFRIRENLSSCLEELSARLPIVTYGSVASQTKILTKYRKIEEVIKDVVAGKVQFNPTYTVSTELKDFVKLSLIDPMFPKFLTDIEKILKKP